MTSELDPNRAAYSLDTLRNVLVRLEDTIVTALIERAQYARNAPIYDAQAEPFASIQDGGGLSFVRYLLREMERVHGMCHRSPCHRSPKACVFV